MPCSSFSYLIAIDAWSFAKKNRTGARVAGEDTCSPPEQRVTGG